MNDAGAVRWQAARNVLAVRLDSLGDVLMTGPAIRALHDGAPGRRVTLLTSASGAEAGALLAGVDQVLEYDAPWLKASATRSDSTADRRMADALRLQRFDAAVIFTAYSQSPLPSALLCFLADIPLRIAHCRENPYQLLTDWIRETEPERGTHHEVRRQLDLVAAAGCTATDDRLAMRVSLEAVETARRLLLARGIEATHRWAVLHPGSTASSRRYPAEQFARVAHDLAAWGWQIVFIGDAAERELVSQIQTSAGASSISLAGDLSLEELGGLLSLAPVLIANNSGPVHVAAAVGTPVVDLYALTNPQHTPWGVPSRVLFHDVPCRWCYRSICPEGHHDCLRLVEPRAVVAAALEVARPPRRSDFAPPAAIRAGAG